MINKTLSTSLEKYLDVIYSIEKVNKVARVKDIAKEMNVTYASVSQALRNLSAKDLIHYDPYQYITLTNEGKVLAEELQKKHRIVMDFFEKVLHIDNLLADKNASRLEHVIDENVLDRFLGFIDFINICPNVNLSWSENTGYSCNSDFKTEMCETCRFNAAAKEHGEA